jgi:SRSO17 transposase
LDLSVRDVDGFADELRQVHDRFDDCFFRSETRENTALYLAGLFSSLERKSVEPIALGMEGVTVRTLQHTISGAKWDEEQFSKRLRDFVAEDLGHPDGALVFDETAFVKKGDRSVGVARQYCGNLGKVENGQVGVFAAYVSPSGYALVDKRLYVPEAWFDAEHAERREICSVPDTLTFQTKPQLAAAMLRSLHAEDVLPFRWILADSIYGENDDFLHAADECTGTCWFVSVAKDTLCWKEGEARRGKPLAVEILAQSIPKTFWYRRTVHEGTKGPIRYDFARLRVVLSRGGEPARAVWLVVKRTPDTSRTWCYLSNAPASVRLGVFVWLSGLRWAIEQCFEETKTELGLDHYEVRGWAGWNRHMLLCMLAHAFLWHLKVRLGEKNAPGYALADPEPATPCPSFTPSDPG